MIGRVRCKLCGTREESDAYKIFTILTNPGPGQLDDPFALSLQTDPLCLQRFGIEILNEHHLVSLFVVHEVVHQSLTQ